MERIQAHPADGRSLREAQAAQQKREARKSVLGKCVVCQTAVSTDASKQRVRIARRSDPSGFPLPDILKPLCEDHLEQLTAWAKVLVTQGDRHVTPTYDAVTRYEQAEWAKRQATFGDAYFMQRNDGMIKIGTSGNVQERKTTLELAAGPLKLLWTEPGGHRREAELHRQFAHLRLHGEWFRPAAEILAYLDAKRLSPQGA